MDRVIEKYDESMRTLSSRAFKDHVLEGLCDPSQDRKQDRWLIAKPLRSGLGYERLFKTEIICMHNNAICVGGDIAVVVFGFGPSNPLDRLVWIGRHVDTEFACEKASIGMSSRYESKSWDIDIARDQLKAFLEDNPDHEDRDRIEAAMDCLDGGGTEKEVWGELPDDAWEYLGGLGRVPGADIYYAQAAVARLCDLLDL